MSGQPTQEELDVIRRDLLEQQWYLQKRNRWGAALLCLGVVAASPCFIIAIIDFLVGRIGTGFFELALVFIDVGIFGRVFQIHRDSLRVERDIKKLLSYL